MQILQPFLLKRFIKGEQRLFSLSWVLTSFSRTLMKTHLLVWAQSALSIRSCIWCYVLPNSHASIRALVVLVLNNLGNESWVSLEAPTAKRVACRWWWNPARQEGWHRVWNTLLPFPDSPSWIGVFQWLFTLRLPNTLLKYDPRFLTSSAWQLGLALIFTLVKKM